MLTGENGILNRATEAKKKNQSTEEFDAIKMAVLEALTNGDGTVIADNLNVTMKNHLGKETSFKGNGPWQYIGTDGAYAITSNGNVSKGWVTINDSNGAPAQVTNGSLTLNIGDYINYDPESGISEKSEYTSEKGIDPTKEKESYITHGINANNVEQDWKNNYKASDYQELLEKEENKDIKDKGNGYKDQTYSVTDAKNGNLKWRVLGTDAETGEVLIIATDVIKNSDNTTKQFIIKGITGYSHGVDELNKICNVYGKGIGATGGRSLTYEEVERAIGKEKSTVSQPWKYSWKSESFTQKAPYYSYKDGEGYLLFSHIIKDTETGIFNYYNEKTKKWETSEEKSLNTLGATKEIATITNTYNGYDINDKNYDETLREQHKATKGYDVLFKTGDRAEINRDAQLGANDRYWLGSSYCYIGSNYANWGMYYVYSGGCIRGNGTYNTFGHFGALRYGVRPVVSLKSDIQLEANSSSINTYDIK